MTYPLDSGSVWLYDGSGDRGAYVDRYNNNKTFDPPITQTVVDNSSLPPILPEVVNEIDLPPTTQKQINVGAVMGWLLLAFVGYKVATKQNRN